MGSRRSRLGRSADLAAALLALCVTGCQSPVESPPSADRDKQAARRIISLAPHLTELVYAAGAGEHLVGVVAFSDYPPAATALPRVGDAFRVDFEAIAGLAPDLILAWESGNPPDVLHRLRRLGFEVLALEPTVLDDIATQLLLIGRLAGTDAVAVAAARAYRRDLADLRRQYQGATPIRVFYQLSARPLFTVSRAHVIGQVIELCGGENVFGDLAEPVPPVSVEAVLEARPEIILASGFGERNLDAVMALWRDWSHLPAVQYGNLFLIDADRISRPGTRILAGIAELCATLETARQRTSIRARPTALMIPERLGMPGMLVQEAGDNE